MLRSSRPALLLVCALILPASTVAACSCGSDTNGNGPTSSGATGSGGAGAGGASATGTGGNPFQMDGGTCSANADCDGGVCNTQSGQCCASADGVCGASCCKGNEQCLFEACVVPGKPCHTANDCDPGQYCETALGDNPDGGVGGGGQSDAGCVQPLPLAGRCLDLPPVCDADAGADAGDGGCVEKCEYHPPVGQLTAIAKWTWDQTNAQTQPNFVDVWSTPAVGRVYDANCDGKVDELDAPDVVFVAGRAIDGNGIGTCCQCTGTTPTSCHTGVLRMLDGRTGVELWSSVAPSANSAGWSGLSPAIGDVDGDGRMDVLAVSGEGFVEMVDANGNVVRTSDQPIPGAGNATFGWGGGLAIADMDGDGFPEIAYAATVFTTTNNAITLKFTGAGGLGGGNNNEALSTFVDLDGDGHLELLAGRAVYKADGTTLWTRADLGDGFPAVGDFDLDGKPEVVLVTGGTVLLLDGATGATKLGPVTLPSNGFGGPPTVADFDGDGKPEIGVAQKNFYAVVKPDFANASLGILWQVPNHDLSSSVTGSSVFDFEGDGKAEVVYADECFLWVFDGQTGAVRFAAPHTSFTATEASLVADVDGDGHAEMLMVSNGADPSANGWKCLDVNGNPTTVNGVTWTPGPATAKAYRGLVLFGDAASSWVGTRTLWNEHTYHVSNVCDDRDTACDAPNVYGSIPKTEKANWTLPWLNDFRQNVQDKGVFDAPDATVSITVACSDPVDVTVSVRNIGLSSLPAGVDVGIFKQTANGDVQVAATATTHPLFPGQTEQLDVQVSAAQATKDDTFIAKILVDPLMPKFHQCRDDNDSSKPTKAECVQ